MNIVVSGGGTAGHINPALALAEVLEERGHTVFFAGTPQGVEADLVPAAGLTFKAFNATGFNRRHPTSLARALRTISKSTREAKDWFKEIQPSVVVGFGGYVCTPVVRAAEQSSIPVVLHEQNSVMGLANKALAKRASTVALTYEAAADALGSHGNIVVTGNPVRTSVLSATREEGRAMLEVPDDALLLVVFGGSLGAHRINAAITSLKDSLLSREDMYVVHVTGPKEYEETLEKLNLSEDEKRRWKVFDYQNHMGATLAAADVVVSRAGATSLAEISALGLPALLIPFPYATGDHQTTNARAYVERGAAFMIADDQVETERFAELLFSLIESPEKRAHMREAAATFKTSDAAAKLADVVLAAAR